jgi:hypothetical protein
MFFGENRALDQDIAELTRFHTNEPAITDFIFKRDKEPGDINHRRRPGTETA